MVDIKRILHPSDFSEFSDRALDYATQLAQKFGAELHLLHVLTDPMSLVQGPADYSLPDGFFEDLIKQAEGALAERPRSGGSGLKVRRVTAVGSAAGEIVRYAGENKADLIVMGTHGLTGLAHLLIGSVAERVARTAPCPVMTVPEPGRSPGA